ncbi:MAG: LysE family transporter [Phaeodactylibacter sp.]|nr:LysE family transporter [Phaeodactylibacter sp.]MCB9048240.1 LysE family transporter [Lewinellaceae bacterium]
MDFLSPFFFGFLLAAVGIALPGMVNMTSVSVSIKQGMRAGLWYSAGSSVTIFLQAYIAVAFAGFLSRHPQVFTYIRATSVAIFLALAFFFFYQALHSKEAKASRRKGSPFLLGMAVAGMNALNIPYFFTMGALLKAEGLIHLYAPYHLFFISGITLSAFIMLSAYARFAQFILKRANYFARNLNYFLSGLFLVLAVVQGVQLYTG